MLLCGNIFFLQNLSDFESSANSKIVILTAGCGKISGDDDTGDEHVRTRNIELFKTIVPTVVKYSPNCVLLVVTNPGKNSFSGLLNCF